MGHWISTWVPIGIALVIFGAIAYIMDRLTEEAEDRFDRVRASHFPKA